MTNNRILTAIRLLVLVMISTSALAQPNLSFVGVADPMDVTTGVELNTTVFFEVNNSSATSANADQSTFNVVYNNTKMTFDAINVDPTPFDQCNSAGNTVTCSCFSTCGGVFDNSVNVTMGLPFALNASSVPTPVGMYSFAATLTNPNAVTSPISTSKNLNVNAAGSPDYNIVPNSSIGSVLVIDPVSSSFIPFGFDLDNDGTSAGVGVDEVVNITVAAGFALQNVIMISANNAWTCVNNSGPNWQCTNNDSVGGMAMGEIATISGDMTSYVTANDTTGAIIANISASSDVDVNLGVNTASLDTVIQSNGPIIFQFITGITDPLIILNEGDISAQTLDYQVVNLDANDAVGGGIVSLAYDNANFSLVNLTKPAGWSCLPAGAFVDCQTSDTILSSATLNFQFNLSALGGTIAGAYNPAVTAIALEDSGFAANSSSTKSSIVVKPSGVSVIQAITNVTILPGLDPDVVIDKTFEQGFFIGATTQAGENSNVTYKLLANAIDTTGVGGSTSAANVVITDTLPAGLTFASMNILGPNFQTPNGSCVHSAGTITCTTSNLPITQADDGVEITVNVNGVLGSMITNTASIASSNDINAMNNTSSPGAFTVASILPTTLSLDKMVIVSGATVQSVMKGGNFIYRLVVNNTGSFDALNVQVFDDMPLGVTVNSYSGTNWSCTNVGQSYDCLYSGTLTQNTSTFIDFNVTDNTGLGVTQLFNSANLEAMNAPSTSGFVTINIVDTDLDVVVTQDPDPIEEDKPFDLIIDIINNGSAVGAGMIVVNTLPDGFSYITTAKSSSCNVAGQDMTCTVTNPIATGAVESIVVGVQSTASAVGTFVNVTTLSGANIPTAVVINTTLNVLNPTGNAIFDFTVDLSDDADPVALNDTFSYFVEMTNTGANEITQMDLDLNIPSDLTIDYNNIVANNMSCSATSFGLKCNSNTNFSISADPLVSVVLIEVPVKSTTFVGNVNVDLSANIVAAIAVQRLANETTTIINGTFTPDLSVDIIHGSDIDQGESTSFEVKIANSSDQNSDKAKNVTLEMEVAGILDNVSVDAGSEWTCQVANQIINCQFNNEIMQIGHQSNIAVTVNTTQVVLDAQDIILSAEVKTESSDSNMVNNTATSLVGVSGTPTEGEIGDALRDALGSTGNPQLDRAIDNISDYCEQQYFSALEGLCDDLFNDALDGESDNVLNFLRQVTPNEVIGQSTSIAELAEAQKRNIQARTNQLRGGGGSGFSTAGLNARYGNSSIPLGMLAYLNQTEDEKKANDIDTNNDFISPWGFFVNGTISMGERDATGRELGFDFDTFGITAGVDYRLDAKKVIGVAIGYASFDSEIEDSAELNSQGITLTGYGSFYINDNFYVDTRISVAKPNFDQSRKIDFTLGDTHIDRTAVGETDANQYSVSMSAGYSFYKNAWNITPNASFTYMSTTIDSFSETGAGDFSFYYAEQDLESLVYSAGIRVSKAISLKNGVLTPQFDFDYNYEGLNDDSVIEARFIRAPDDQLFIIETDSPDRSYGSAGIGFVYISANGKQAYFNYRSVLGLEGFSRGTYNIGARFEF